MIIIEQQALLSVLTNPPLHKDCDDDLEYVLVSSPKESSSGPFVQSLRLSTSFEDDCCSLTSTTCSDDELESKRVTFSEDDEVHIVKKVYPKETLSEHFYSYEDTQRFRQDYRLERKLLAELDVDSTNHDDKLSDLFAATTEQAKHHISHVVVLHNDRIETFCDPKQQAPVNLDDFFDNDSFWSGSITW
eukprot:CAMPEP_0194209668 /NCGR_PEP_ID=MMETSP0156-20130528/7705_1 /TAXON_ID=33649 /ORGANISM="Thalassionema nitzschioides, Strain L26-B" /LENGTH=188 /DNA_ID=CAMNT_0038936869 /DNA_START=49 /DNA_END=612 /DNA_ORIENTATION=+